LITAYNAHQAIRFAGGIKAFHSNKIVFIRKTNVFLKYQDWEERAYRQNKKKSCVDGTLSLPNFINTQRGMPKLKIIHFSGNVALNLKLPIRVPNSLSRLNYGNSVL
jgi:hypothetical protein